MSAELGGSQISSLLEALPGIASVLRSPVADALVKAIRAAAGVGEFAFDDAEELDRKSTRLNSSHANISYAVICLKKQKHDAAHRKVSFRTDHTLCCDSK